MHFDLTDDQRAIQDAARAFAAGGDGAPLGALGRGEDLSRST